MIAFEGLVSAPFLEKVKAISARQGVDPSHLMAVMRLETGKGFPKPTAHGLLGFVPGRPERASQSPIQALDEVEAYLARATAKYGHLRSLEDLYMSVNFPAAVGFPDETVLYSASGLTDIPAVRSHYTAREIEEMYRDNNRGAIRTDTDGNGVVTRGEVVNIARRVHAAGLGERQDRKPAKPGRGAVLPLLLLILGWLFIRARRSDG